ncbi:hypothetical protein ABZ837_34205 [Streptomyces sp. NPDC047197]|uniref:hypothetical protein n=1 Tax=Streptomyces sp. NPDC047197 TaxID=3155477 RepID=UPI00340C84AB
MRLLTHDTVQRVWTVEVRSHRHGPVLSCSHCPSPGEAVAAGGARRSALAHLARHARNGALPAHLRTCQCRERGCNWHRRLRGCHGPVRLALTGEGGGFRWRLADVCTACAAVTAHTALVPEDTQGPRDSRLPLRMARPPQDRESARIDAQARVREMLAYLATALPRYCSPTARLLALQCILRANGHGEASLPHGLLRGMRLHRHTEPWEELEYTGWLQRTVGRGPVQVRLLDPAVQTQSHRPQRARAAHWALHPLCRPAVPRALPGAVQLAALTVAAHTRPDGTGTAEMDLLMHLCAQTSHQLSDLLDQLTASRLISSWRRTPPEAEVTWQLPYSGRATERTSPSTEPGGAKGRPRDHSSCA